MFDNNVDISDQYGSKKIEPKQELPPTESFKPRRTKVTKPSTTKRKRSKKPKLTKQQKFEYWKEKENERFWMNNL